MVVDIVRLSFELVTALLLLVYWWRWRASSLPVDLEACFTGKYGDWKKLCGCSMLAAAGSFSGLLKGE
ncbi:hypothetical protein KY285_023719 [Solanum tuberosum]|nr:hypothetical protein KY289_024049 [Solanum tuberosum]KAH0675918.1 hypothetical protein KY285_023719 [Solanum tuberosum]